MANSTAGLTLDIDASSAPSAARDLSRVDAQASRTARAAAALSKAWGPVSTAFAAAGAAAVAAAAGLAYATKEAIAADRAANELRGALGRQGIAWGDVSTQVEAYARAQQDATRQGDDATLASLGNLAELTQGLDASIDQLIGWQRLAADVAEATGKSLGESEQAVAAAAAGNLRALNSLIPGMREANREMTATGTAAERSAYAIEAMDDAFGGAARSIEPFDLAASRASNSFGNLVESIGQAVTQSPEAQQALGDVATATQQISDAFAAGTPLGAQWAETIGTGARWAGAAVLTVIEGLLQANRLFAQVTEGRSMAEAAAARDALQGEINNIRALARGVSEGSEEAARAAQSLVFASEGAGDGIVENTQTIGAALDDQLVALETRQRQLTAAADAAAAAYQAEANARDRLIENLGRTPDAPGIADMAPATGATSFAPPDDVAPAVQTVADAYTDLAAAFDTALSSATDYAAAFEWAAQAQFDAADRAKNQAIEIAAKRNDELAMLDAERLAQMEDQSAAEEEIENRRRQAGERGARTIASVLMAIEGRTQKERMKALRKAIGGVLVQEGTGLIIQGVGNLVAMNYAKGAAEVAGGGIMVAAGSAMGGGGGGAAASRPAPVEQQQPQQVITNNNTVVNLTSGIPDRSLDRARREPSTRVGL